MRGGVRVVAVAALLGAAAACGSAPRPVSETGPAPAATAAPTTIATTAATSVTTVPSPVGGLVATVEVARLFIQIRSFGLGLQNAVDAPVEVATVQLESPLYEVVAPIDQPVVLTPGRFPTVVPVPYGDPICEEGLADDDFTAVVTLADGTPLRIPAPEHFAGAIRRTHDRECAARAVLDQVDIRFGEDWVREGDEAVVGAVLLDQRRPGPTAVVQSLAGTVIFGFDAEGDDGDPGTPILEVTDDDPSVVMPVVISVGRCDPHGLIEAKRAFVFEIFVQLGDAHVAGVELRPEGPARAALDQLLADCAGEESFEEEP